MGKIPRLALWLCRKFTRQELQELVHELEEVLAGWQPEPPVLGPDRPQTF
jgi:hypothetical protein